MKKKQRNDWRERLEYWLNECNTHSLALVTAELLTLFLLCLLTTLLLATCRQVQTSTPAEDADATTDKSVFHIAHYRRPEIRNESYGL